MRTQIHVSVGTLRAQSAIIAAMPSQRSAPRYFGGVRKLGLRPLSSPLPRPGRRRYPARTATTGR